MLYKPLTAPTPRLMGITSLQIMHHFTTVTSASFDSKAVDPFHVNLQVDSVETLGHLQQIYDFRMPGVELESEELLDSSIRTAYRKAVEAFYVVYPLSRTGYETKSPIVWPALFGKKFRDLLNERRQRALVILYYYLGMLKWIGERYWWANETTRCQDYIYGLLDVGWRGWILQYGVMENLIASATGRLE